MQRRRFIQKATSLAGALLLTPSVLSSQSKGNQLVTVLGPIAPEELGITLIHEHVMADFIGAADTGTHRYDPDTIVRTILPHLLELKNAGCNTFVDCTPVYLGRDVRILKRLASESGLNIITNTGYYGAVKQKFLPAHAYTETEQQLATRWIDEWKNGIEGTGIRPGFIKTSVDEGPLVPVCKKIVAAVAMAHLKTGLSISAHTGDGKAALEEIAILEKAGVHASAFRWVHAQQEKNKEIYLRAAKLGAWLEFDGINKDEPGSITHHLDCVKFMKEHGHLNKTLISQDAGWYWVGEPNGGVYRSYTTLFDTFIPALKQSGFTSDEINQLLITNPRESMAIRVRTN